ncbi:RNA polymerase sigma factor [Enterococcus durans]|uniref:RNA polymerase sigma factor n=1 Tax=Enterococcus durans TaxID=53345 RepID=UPI0035618D66
MIQGNIDSYKFSGKFFNYLFTVAVNACNNYSKKQKFEESEFDESYADHSNLNAKNKEVADSKGDEIQNALDALPEYQREAIILRFYYDMKVKEVAMVTGTSVATAQSRIQQGLDKLKRLLKREDFYFE